MTVTRSQALDYSIQYFHFEGNGAFSCNILVGPRGGKRTFITSVRRNGATKTWKTRPDDFSMPVRYGIRARDQFRIDNENAYLYHAETECPLNVSQT